MHVGSHTAKERPNCDRSQEEAMLFARRDSVELTMSNDNSQSGYGSTRAPSPESAAGKCWTVASRDHKEWVFMIIAVVSIVAVAALTIISQVRVVEDDPDSFDFAFYILLFINEALCLYFVVHGVKRERTYELFAFLAVIVVLAIYCILDYFVLNPSQQTTVKLIRMIVVCAVALPNMILAWCVSRDFGFQEYRIVGSNETLPGPYRQAAMFYCLLLCDLLATCSVIVLVLEHGTAVSVTQIVILAVGLPFSFLWFIIGCVLLMTESKVGTAAFAVIGVVKPVFYAYRAYEVDKDIAFDSYSFYSLCETAIALVVWGLLMWKLIVVYRNFDKGLKERIRDILETENATHCTVCFHL